MQTTQQLVIMLPLPEQLIRLGFHTFHTNYEYFFFIKNCGNESAFYPHSSHLVSTPLCVCMVCIALPEFAFWLTNITEKNYQCFAWVKKDQWFSKIKCEFTFHVKDSHHRLFFFFFIFFSLLYTPNWFFRFQKCLSVLMDRIMQPCVIVSLCCVIQHCE